LTPHNAEICLLKKSQATAPVGVVVEMAAPSVPKVVLSTTTLPWLRRPRGSGAVPLQAMTPADAVESLILANPGVQVWFIEGLDLWSKNMVKMEILSPEIDALQRVATKHNVCVLATVGAPKMKGDERYFGRDALYGSSVLARKVETVILIALSNREDADSARQYDIYPRNGKMEKMYLKWEPSQGLMVTEKPPDLEPVKKISKAMGHMARNCFHKFKPGDEVVYSRELGSEGTFYRWRDDAVDMGQVVQHSGGYFMAASGSGVVTSA